MLNLLNSSAVCIPLSFIQTTVNDFFFEPLHVLILDYTHTPFKLIIQLFYSTVYIGLVLCDINEC